MRYIRRCWTALAAFPFLVLAWLYSLKTRLAAIRHVSWWTKLVLRFAGLVVYALAWCTAQSIRFLLDLNRRKRLCQAATSQAANAIARSLLVRSAYTACCLWSLASGYFWVTATMVSMFVMAEIIWHFVLYTAALVGRLDDGMEFATDAAAAQLAKLGKAAENVIQPPVPTLAPAPVPVV